jgi:N-acetylglucosaminyl-diphospho-decaprenol L-rhamnosyltransferase
MPADSPVQPDVTIAIVSFNTRELLAACLRSVFSTTNISFEVCVVDNGSADGSAEMVARDFTAARLIRSGGNIGFAAANNRALRAANGRYLLLLNPDTVVSPSTIGDMVSFMDQQQHWHVAICGPRILFPDGTFQSCGYRFPTLMSEIRQSKNIDKLLRLVVGEEPPLKLEPGPFEVDWVDGACLLIREEAISQIGTLDEQFFLYAEELDWCHRARNAGWGVYALPTIEMVHYQGKSSAQMSDFSLALLVETRLRYYRKTHGTTMAAVTSLVYVAGCLKQLNRDRRKARVKLRATMRWWRTLVAA